MTDETKHIATAAALLDDRYAALSQHMHGDGETEMEHIARDIREGRFPKRSERRTAPPSTSALLPADPDLSPEAVERLTRELDNWATIAEADRDMEMQDAKHTGERPDMQPVLVEVDLRECRAAAATLRALSTENERLRAERDAAWQAGAEAMRSKASRTALATPASRSDKAGVVWHDGFTSGCLHAADRIRALPLPDKEA